MTSSGKLVGCLVEFLHSTACLDKCHKLFFCHNGLPPEMVLVIILYPLWETLISEQIVLRLWIERVVYGRMGPWVYGP